MKIKNVSRFLASAVIIACAQSGHAHLNANDSAGTSRQLAYLNVDPGSLSTLKARNLLNESVSMLPGNLIKPEQLAQFSESYGNNFAMTGLYKGKTVCAVFVDPLKDHDKYIPLQVEDEVYAIIDRNAYLYSIVAHELSHCMGHPQSLRFEVLTSASEPGAFTEQTSAIDVSAREVHADLTATLLGASRTGDWTVFHSVFMPMRSNYFDPTHTTLLSVYEIIKDIDPASLKGESFEVIAAVANQLFKDRFLDAQGILSMQSVGVQTILSEWQAAILEYEAYVVDEPVDTEKAAKVAGFKVFIDQHTHGQAHYQRVPDLFAIKVVNLISQNNEAHRLLGSDPLGRDGFVESNQQQIKSLDMILLNEGKRLGIDYLQTVNQAKAIRAWQVRHGHTQSPQVLSESLSRLMSDSFAPAGTPDVDDQIQAAHRRAQERYAQILGTSTHAKTIKAEDPVRRTQVTARPSPQDPSPR